LLLLLYVLVRGAEQRLESIPKAAVVGAMWQTQLAYCCGWLDLKAGQTSSVVLIVVVVERWPLH
jgi:hypothetical protein